jgi:GDP-L-fucose synthase
MKYLVAGASGMVGSAILQLLLDRQENGGDLEVLRPCREELNLLDQGAVKQYFLNEKPDLVVLAAAKVGGILANNSFPAEFIYQNLSMQCNVIHEAYNSNVEKLLFLGSSCIYPRLASQPIAESELLSGKLEPTNEPYAIAKIAGIKMCESYNRQYGTDFRCVMPTNLYGPGDNYHEQNSHVIPALIRRFHEAKEKNADSVVIWGSGEPLREFMHAADMASASLFVLDMKKTVFDTYTDSQQTHINIGSGQEISIRALAQEIAEVVGFKGRIVFDSSKPDGTPRKLLDTSKLSSMGWKSSISLREGLYMTYAEFSKNSVYRE